MEEIQNVARYILSKSNPEIGEIISNLKLQKLLYYCQGFYLAINDGKPLFSEDLVAWQYGPVVPEVYREYSRFGSNAIMLDNLDGDQGLSKSAKEIIDEVYDVYGQFSAWKLMDMTHNEMPWKETAINNIISVDRLKTFFSTLIN